MILYAQGTMYPRKCIFCGLFWQSARYRVDNECKLSGISELCHAKTALKIFIIAVLKEGQPYPTPNYLWYITTAKNDL